MGDFQKKLDIKPKPNMAAQAVGKEPKLTQPEIQPNATQTPTPVPNTAPKLTHPAIQPNATQNPTPVPNKEPNLMRPQSPLLGLLSQLQNQNPRIGGK